MKNMLLLAALLFSDVLLFGSAYTVGGSGTWYLAAAWTLFVLWEVISYLTMPRIVEVERIVSRERGFSGDDVSVRLKVSVKRRWWALQPVRVEEKLDDVLRIRQTYEQPPHRLAHALCVSYTFRALPRGAYTLRELTVECTDLFGLFTRRQSVEKVTEWLIYPRIIPLPAEFTASSLLRAERGARSHVFVASAYLSGTRPYVPGDRLSGIHWPATARSQQLQSKMFDTHASHLTYLWLDDRMDHDLPWEIFERSVGACASVASALLSAERLTGLLLEGGTLAPKRGFLQRERILESLARVKPRRLASAELSGIARADLWRMAARDAAFYVFTQNLDEALMRDLGALMRQNPTVVVFLAQTAGGDCVMDRHGVTVCSYTSFDALAEMIHDGHLRGKPPLMR